MSHDICNIYRGKWLLKMSELFVFVMIVAPNSAAVMLVMIAVACLSLCVATAGLILLSVGHGDYAMVVYVKWPSI